MDSSSDLHRHLRRYKLDALLMGIGDITRKMMVFNQPIQTVNVEFECFISVLNKSEVEAEIIIDNKIKTQHNPKEGIEFSQIIPRISKIGNTYNNQVLNHLENYFPGLEREVT